MGNIFDELILNFKHAHAVYFSGDDFLKVFSHDTAGGLFTDISDAMSKNPDNPEADLFSILDKLEDYRKPVGHFHFKLCYPELQGVNGGHCNEWKQSSNPVSQGTVSQFRPISIEFEKDGWMGGVSWMPED